MDIVTSAILQEVEGVDFGCVFIEGKCVAVDKRIDRGLKPIYQICCRGCHHNVGYLSIKEADLPSDYQNYFSHPNGFLTETGCGLPVAMRSRRCVIYICVDSEISDADRVLLKNLEETT